MNVNNINQIFNQKIQDINSRLPENTNVTTKFQSLLEQVQLKNSETNVTSESTSEVQSSSSSEDINSLLKTMISTQSLLSSSSAFSDSDSSIFPTSTLNNSINTLQQTQLLKILNNTYDTNN